MGRTWNGQLKGYLICNDPEKVDRKDIPDLSTLIENCVSHRGRRSRRICVLCLDVRHLCDIQQIIYPTTARVLMAKAALE